MRLSAGVTLVELLISIVLLGALLAAVAGAVATMFGATRSAQSGINANAQAREVMEVLRAQWTNGSAARAAYDANCIKIALPDGATVTVGAVNPATNTYTPQPVNVVPPEGICPAGGYNQSLKRIQVTIQHNGRALSHLTLELPRP